VKTLSLKGEVSAKPTEREEAEAVQLRGS